MGTGDVRNKHKEPRRLAIITISLRAIESFLVEPVETNAPKDLRIVDGFPWGLTYDPTEEVITLIGESETFDLIEPGDPLGVFAVVVEKGEG